jgi:hypothetical protein
MELFLCKRLRIADVEQTFEIPRIPFEQAQLNPGETPTLARSSAAPVRNRATEISSVLHGPTPAMIWNPVCQRK